MRNLLGLYLGIQSWVIWHRLIERQDLLLQKVFPSIVREWECATSELRGSQWDWWWACSGQRYLASQVAPWGLAEQEGLLSCHCWVAGVQLHMQPSPVLLGNGGTKGEFSSQCLVFFLPLVWLVCGSCPCEGFSLCLCRSEMLSSCVVYFFSLKVLGRNFLK